MAACSTAQPGKSSPNNSCIQAGHSRHAQPVGVVNFNDLHGLAQSGGVQGFVDAFVYKGHILQMPV